MLTAQDYQGLYGIIPTPALPGADRYAAVDTVDLDETERLINVLIRDGVTGLIVLGTTGECATLSEADYDAFVECALETVGRRVPTLVGATAMGAHQSVHRLRKIQDLGADGTLLGLPMWQPLTTKPAVSFYAEISRIFPDLAVMVYANARAFRYDFPADFWAAVAQAAPTVTSAKYSRTAGLTDLIAATKHRINFVPNDMVVQDFFAISPSTTTACWATAAAMNPVPCVALMEAIRQNRTQAIDELAAAIRWANEPVSHIFNNAEIFGKYTIQLEKTRINAAGYSACGPVRPPYTDFPETYAAPSRECGARWAAICTAYRGSFEFAERPWLPG